MGFLCEILNLNFKYILCLCYSSKFVNMQVIKMWTELYRYKLILIIIKKTRLRFPANLSISISINVIVWNLIYSHNRYIRLQRHMRSIYTILLQYYISRCRIWTLIRIFETYRMQISTETSLTFAFWTNARGLFARKIRTELDLRKMYS